MQNININVVNSLEARSEGAGASAPAPLNINIDIAKLTVSDLVALSQEQIALPRFIEIITPAIDGGLLNLPAPALQPVVQAIKTALMAAFKDGDANF